MERTVTEQSKAPLKAIAAAIKRHREAAGLSLTEAARRAQIAKSTLSQLESGVGNPSVETLWALALALDVSFTDLVDPPRAGVVIMRAGEGQAVRSEHSDYAITLLAHAPAGSRRDLYKLAAEPGPARESEPHTPGHHRARHPDRRFRESGSLRIPGHAARRGLHQLSRGRPAHLRGTRSRDKGDHDRRTPLKAAAPTAKRVRSPRCGWSRPPRCSRPRRRRSPGRRVPGRCPAGRCSCRPRFLRLGATAPVRR